MSSPLCIICILFSDAIVPWQIHSIHLSGLTNLLSALEKRGNCRSRTIISSPFLLVTLRPTPFVPRSICRTFIYLHGSMKICSCNQWWSSVYVLTESVQIWNLINSLLIRFICRLDYPVNPSTWMHWCDMIQRASVLNLVKIYFTLGCSWIDLLVNISIMHLTLFHPSCYVSSTNLIHHVYHIATMITMVVWLTATMIIWMTMVIMVVTIVGWPTVVVITHCRIKWP